MGKFNKNDIVLGCVTGIENYGIFVTLDEYYNGLIHISEITDGFVKDINKYVDIGESIKVRVLESDDVNYHVKLSIKNIDYRINKKNFNKIEETERGFSTLKEKLEIWIKDKEKNEKKQENH